MAKPKNKGGRPTDYTVKLGTKICARIASGESLLRICKDDDMPCRAIVHLWLLDPVKKEFLDKYETACNVRAENMFDELNDIADDSRNDFMKKESKDGKSFTVPNQEVVSRARLRVDTRKWYLSKVMPKKFGDKIDVTSGNKPIPLLHAIHDNNSNPEDTKPQEEN